jgi:FixJ family two-component response regulator
MDEEKPESRRDIRFRRSTSADGSEQQVKSSSSHFVHIVDDDRAVRESLAYLLRSMGYQVAHHSSASDFLNVTLPDAPTCLVLDVRLPDMSGLELQEKLARLNISIPIILMTAFGDIPMAVKGMKAGAIDFLIQPIRDQDLLDAVRAAIRLDQGRRQEIARTGALRERFALLTHRERQVVARVASGLMNKHVATELSISEVTVKMHRSNAMRKLGVKSVAKLARMMEKLDISRGHKQPEAVSGVCSELAFIDSSWPD